MLVGKCRVTVLGSVHSNSKVLDQLRGLKISHVGVELCQNRLKSLQSGRKGSADMSSVVGYCNSEKINLHCIDDSIFLTAAKFHNLSRPARLDILKYIFTPRLFLTDNPVSCIINRNAYYSPTPLEYQRLCDRYRVDELLLQILITERDETMAAAIRKIAETVDELVVVVGELHVPGLTKNLSGPGNSYPPSEISPTISDFLKLKVLEKLIN